MLANLGIIGGGVMAEAILSRLIQTKICLSENILVSDPQQKRCSWLREKYHIQTTSDNDQALASEVVLLAIKPQILDVVVTELTPASWQHQPLIISILAGVPLTKLESIFSQQAVIRVMPNTPATVGAAMSAIAAGNFVSGEQLKLAKSMFKAIGDVVEVPEYLMDAVTGLSGSGPAYVAMMVEALADGGVAAGLPRSIAHQLALQTVFGTAQLLKESNLHPAQLKDQVTSPGGTTIAAVATLESKGFRSAIIEAVKTAYQRSHELGIIKKGS